MPSSNPTPDPRFDPRFDLNQPSPPPAPLPGVKPVPSGNGWAGRIFLGLSILGMIGFSPVLFKLKSYDEGEVFTGPILLQTLGFLFSLILFGAMIGVRAVHWIAEWFVDLIFSANGGGYNEESGPEEEWTIPKKKQGTNTSTETGTGFDEGAGPF